MLYYCFVIEHDNLGLFYTVSQKMPHFIIRCNFKMPAPTIQHA